ncbi:RAMP superfamily CRISPR-associated protein, partial [Dehalococcoidia bacterium]|nr:RAMP superfamily CRISPR-associated protein [Dehalococcoidia bacterium]
MLKKILNEARITFYIEATGPLLIKDGETDEERKERKEREERGGRRGTSPDMRFVVDASDKIFIPGSSLRGVWRSWCEKIARTISDGKPLACDPFDDNNGSINISCSKILEKEQPSEVYRLSCPICKLFGNTSQASRLRISDAYGPPVDREKLPVRDGIGIDRFTGGASSGAKFRYQYLIGETFKTEVQIRNFELWQLGLLGYLFRDFKEELVPIGFGKTRGLGKVKGTVKEAELTFYGLNAPEIDKNAKTIKISGIGTLYNEPDRENYGFD